MWNTKYQTCEIPVQFRERSQSNVGHFSDVIFLGFKHLGNDFSSEHNEWKEDFDYIRDGSP